MFWDSSSRTSEISPSGLSRTSGKTSGSPSKSSIRQPVPDAKDNRREKSPSTLTTLFTRGNNSKKEETETENEVEVERLRKHFESIPLSLSIFRLGSTLGTGTFGRVRLVHYNHRTRLHFALKMLKKSEIIRLKQVEHIKSEKNILAQISNPFIVTLYTSFQDATNLYFVMEYVIGGELFTMLRKKNRFINDTAKFYASEIVLALEYLHSKNIVYRDLKPENLLFDKDGHIKITDFGFAKVVDGRTWTLCGTPEYLAPEIIQSKGHGKSVDWWALGILIYEMLCGMPPFHGDNSFAIYKQILAGDIKYPSHMDQNARDLVARLLSPDISQRFGCLRDGAEDVKQHAWFRGTSWSRVFARQVRPPFVPAYRAPDDTSNFEHYPDDPDGDIGLQLSELAQDAFKDF
jgi:serine/threonine protein kinase